MICGWLGMGNRERLAVIARSLIEGIERVDAMQRCRYDDADDSITFRVDTGSLPWTRVHSVDVDRLAVLLDMSLAQLEAWVTYDPKPDVNAVAPEDVARTVAEADALWDALDEC